MPSPPKRTPLHRRMQPSGFFAVRSPLLPLEQLDRLSEGLLAPGAKDDALAEAVVADRRRVRARLSEWLADPAVQEALWLASPNLMDGLSAWRNSPEGERGQKVERSLMRYAQRMSARSTPFGTLAGMAKGSIDRHTRLTFAPQKAHRRVTRLDMDYLWRLAFALLEQPAVRASTRFEPSTSLLKVGDRLRLVETVFDEAQRERQYRLSSVEATEFIEAALERARGGATLDELALHLCGLDGEVEKDEALGFLDELVASQLLVSTQLPNATGEDATRALRGLFPQNDPGRAVFEQAIHALKELDVGGLGQPPSRYETIAQGLEALPVKPHRARLFQVDLWKEGDGLTLSGRLVDELLSAVEYLHRLRPLVDPLRDFKTRFEARYESAWVSLLEALDAESGPGFPTRAESADLAPVLKTLDFPLAGEATGRPMSPFDRRLLARLEEAVARGERVLELGEADVPEKVRTFDLSPTLTVRATLLAASAEALERGDYQLLFHGAVGGSGAQLLGRFGHLDEPFLDALRGFVRAEESAEAEAIFAEVVHLPPGRIGNVIARPLLRAYELPYLGTSGAPREHHILPQELEVTLREGRFHLRSTRLGRRVIPRLTNAHNVDTRQNLPLYRFLYLIQAQAMAAGADFHWGPLTSLPFLPRVTWGRFIFAPATWRLSGKELEELVEKDGAALLSALRTVRRRRGLPRFVLWRDDDNTLPLDLENVASVEAAFSSMSGQTAVALEEVLERADQALARGPEGRYAHELVVPVVRRAEGSAARAGPSRATTAEAEPRPTLRRTFPPGSEWLYLKAYVGSTTADRLLTEVLGPTAQALLERGVCDQWFFLRYGDPDWHLRLRLRGEARRLWSEGLSALTQALEPCLAQGLVSRVALDTYERELERYGGDGGMELSEALFFADSRAALELLSAYPGDAGLDARWRLLLLGMHRLLDDLAVPLDERARLLAGVRDAFAEEFNATPDFLGQVGERLRRERKELEALVMGEELPEALSAGVRVLDRRSLDLAPWTRSLREADRQGRLTRPLGELLASYLHMHANRLLRSSAREQELVLYELLARLYRTQLARRAKPSAG